MNQSLSFLLPLESLPEVPSHLLTYYRISITELMETFLNIVFSAMTDSEVYDYFLEELNETEWSRHQYSILGFSHEFERIHSDMFNVYLVFKKRLLQYFASLLTTPDEVYISCVDVRFIQPAFYAIRLDVASMQLHPRLAASLIDFIP